MSQPYSRELALAEMLADTTRPVVMKHFREPLDIIAKDDASPVTIADREAEKAMRVLVGETFPDHGILGEEFGAHNMDADYVWVLDPIDGTKAFISGIPMFGTLISLCRAGKPVIGIIDMPALNERWIGCEGTPSTFNAKPINVRSCARLGDAWLYASSPHMFEGDDFPAFERVRKQARHALYGVDCYAYGMLANGTGDLVIEATMGIHDFCALVPVITGAGGFISDWQGQPLGLQSDGRVLAAGDQAMALKARELLNA